MNRLRKIGQWFWRNKERMVLAVLVVILCFRIYRMLNPIPDETAEAVPPSRAGNQLPLDAERPPLPLPLEAVYEVDDWSSLSRRNPFFWSNVTGSGEVSVDGVPQDLKVVRIRETRDGVFSAQIRTQSSTKWYNEGDEFEIYTLQRIDAEAKCCTFRASNQRRSFDICVEERRRRRTGR